MINYSKSFYLHPPHLLPTLVLPQLALATPQIGRERSRERDKDVRQECVRQFRETEEDPLRHSGITLWSNGQTYPRITYCRGLRPRHFPCPDASWKTGKNSASLHRRFHDATPKSSLQDCKSTEFKVRHGVHSQVRPDKTGAVCWEGDQVGQGFPVPPREALTSTRWLSAQTKFPHHRGRRHRPSQEK